LIKKEREFLAELRHYLPADAGGQFSPFQVELAKIERARNDRTGRFDSGSVH
jgi:hypothetical protein